MKTRWILAGVFGLAALAGVYMAVITWTEPDGGRWMFVAFAALFGVLSYSAVRPAKARKPRSIQFVPAWYFEGAILILAVLILLVVASCIFGRK
jgi:hypothetical protein